jgi:hypothetical protein
MYGQQKKHTRFDVTWYNHLVLLGLKSISAHGSVFESEFSISLHVFEDLSPPNSDIAQDVQDFFSLLNP